MKKVEKIIVYTSSGTVEQTAVTGEEGLSAYYTERVLAGLGTVALGFAIWYFFGSEIPSIAHSIVHQIEGVAGAIKDGGSGVYAFLHQDIELKPGANFVDLAQTSGSAELIKLLHSFVKPDNVVSGYMDSLASPIK